MMKIQYKVILFFATIIISPLFALSTARASVVGEIINFNVSQSYDTSLRSSVQATLIKITPNLSFYVEKSWWDTQTKNKQVEILVNFDSLSSEFTNKIYPTLTSLFGFEWIPGIDGDSKITILFHSMREDVSGYFRSGDEYSKLQVPDSNEREMLYFSTSRIDDSLLKMFVAHEFTHLITFNQKDRLQNVQEDIWLNEARADYASTIMGYDDTYEGSNLQRRVEDFLNSPSDSLTEWQETKYDYAVVNLFTHYLVDHYGVAILADSLKFKSVGITSLNEALLKNGAKEDFASIFTDWTIAIIVNDCLQDARFCYTSKNVDNLKINPTLIFLPLVGNSSLSTTNTTKNWSGNWQKVIGGNGDLTLEFSGPGALDLHVPYVLYDKANNYSINFLKLDKNKKGEISIKDFGQKYNSLVIAPSLQAKSSGFSEFELAYPYTFKVSITGYIIQEDQVLIQKLLAQIYALKRQIASLQSGKPVMWPVTSCFALQNNLSMGILNNSEVNCLQQFLKSQGADIYPEGFVTGNFGVLTKSAVIRFQEKYKNEILIPVGLVKGTGFVGNLTRAKINSLLRVN